jgi:CBS domain-containing protein
LTVANEDIHVKVGDVMSAPVVTVYVDDRLDKIAALMRRKKVGSIVVLDENSNPVGVITERDIVERVVSKNMMPNEVKAEEVMSKPLSAIGYNVSIMDASKVMRNIGIRRLMVVEGKKLVGIISSDDIAKIMPELITIISEKVSISRRYTPREESGMVGRCARCDRWSNNLEEREGIFLCEECLAED